MSNNRIIDTACCTNFHNAIGCEGNTYWQFVLIETDKRFFDLRLQFAPRIETDFISQTTIHGITAENIETLIKGLEQMRDSLDKQNGQI